MLGDLEGELLEELLMQAGLMGGGYDPAISYTNLHVHQRV